MMQEGGDFLGKIAKLALITNIFGVSDSLHFT